MRILFLFGPPNAGKTTQLHLFSERGSRALGGISVKTLSIGSWLRTTSESKSLLGDFLVHNWSNDALSPIVTDLVDTAIGEAPANCLFVIDGFPRSTDEVAAIPRICRGNHTLVAELSTLDKEVYGRKGEREGREGDDTVEAFDIRIAAYRKQSAEIFAALAQYAVAHARIPTSQGPEGVFAQLIAKSVGAAQRTPIPPAPPRITLARGMFHEAPPIAAACVVQRCLRLAQSTRLRKQFFGTHPISFLRDHMPRIQRFPYLVALKATGTRYLALVMAKRLWLVSREMEVFEGSKLNAELAHHEGTLLDGELLGGDAEANTYLVLDCLASREINCMRKPILERMRETQAIGALFHKGSFCMKPQIYLERERIKHLFSLTKELPWDVDGVILQPARLPYRLGLDYNLFKWKPLRENTVDALFYAADRGLYCRKSKPDPKDASTPCAIDFTNAPTLTKDGVTYVCFGRVLEMFLPKWVRDGIIIECCTLPATHVGHDILHREGWRLGELVWVPSRHRADKSLPNVDWVLQGVVQSILDDVTEDEIVGVCEARRLQGARGVKAPPKFLQ